MTLLEDLHDLAELYGNRENIHVIERGVYKYTDCGAWFNIVEGYTTGRTVKMPIKLSINNEGYLGCIRYDNQFHEPEEFFKRYPSIKSHLIQYDGLGWRDQMYCFISDQKTRDFIKGCAPEDGSPAWFDIEYAVPEEEFKDIDPSLVIAVQVGSIVEGVDQVTGVETLVFPFTSDEWWAALDSIESQARDIWNETHGCPYCHQGDAMYPSKWWEHGNTYVDPDCRVCKGYGMIV